MKFGIKNVARITNTYPSRTIRILIKLFSIHSERLKAARVVKYFPKNPEYRLLGAAARQVLLRWSPTQELVSYHSKLDEYGYLNYVFLDNRLFRGLDYVPCILWLFAIFYFGKGTKVRERSFLSSCC